MKGCLALIFVTLLSGVVFGHFARSRHHERIEQILNQRVTGITQTFPEIDVSYDHLTARVTGKATRAELAQIKEKIDILREGNGRVHYAVEIVRREPANFIITRDKQKITLKGRVDSGETRQNFDAILSLSGMAVENRLEVSDEVAPFPAMVSAIASIPLLITSAGDARLEADPAKVQVSGTVETKLDKQILTGMFTTDKWNGAKIIDQLKVKPPPPPPPPVKQPPQPPSFSWNQKGKKIILKGRLPDSAIRTALIDSAKKVATVEGRVDHIDLKVVPNTKKADWLAKFPDLATKTFSEIRDPNFRLGPNDSNFSGTIVGSDTREKFCAEFTGINPPGLTMAVKVLPRPKPKPKPKPPEKKPAAAPLPAVTSNTKAPSMPAVPKPAPLPAVAMNSKSKPVPGKPATVSSKPATAKSAPDPLPSVAENSKTKPMPDKPAPVSSKPPAKKSAPAPLPEVAMNSKTQPAKGRPGPVSRKSPVNKKPPETIPVSKPPKIKERHEVYFRTGEYHIRSSEKDAVAEILERVKANRGSIIIDGFADTRGDVETNQFLSEQRAKRIRDYLVGNGVDPARIKEVTGRGEQKGLTYPKARKTEVRIVE